MQKNWIHRLAAEEGDTKAVSSVPKPKLTAEGCKLLHSLIDTAKLFAPDIDLDEAFTSAIFENYGDEGFSLFDSARAAVDSEAVESGMRQVLKEPIEDATAEGLEVSPPAYAAMSLEDKAALKFLGNKRQQALRDEHAKADTIVSQMFKKG